MTHPQKDEHVRTWGKSGIPFIQNETSMLAAHGPMLYVPTDIAFTPSGEMQVSDGYANARVQVFSAADAFQH